MNNTLRKGLQVLELLAGTSGSLGVTRLAEATGLGKSNVHRLLQALVDDGYVAQTPDGEYRATLRVWELGQLVIRRLDVRTFAEPLMYRLLEKTRESVHLSILDGADVIYVHKLDSPEPVRSYSEVGGRAPAYAVATGKALLAYASDAQLASVAARLRRHTPSTMATIDDLQRDLRQVRQRGYSVNRGEWRDSVWGIAAPITVPEGIALAAIGISGPAERIRAKAKDWAALVIDAAREVEARIAGRD